MDGVALPQPARRSAQGTALRRRMAARLAAWTLVYLLAFALLVAWVQFGGLRDYADRIADSTSEWLYVDREDVVGLWGDQGDEAGRIVVNADSGRLEIDPGDIQVIPQEDGRLAVRDLSTYHALKALKWPVAAVAFLVGYVALVLVLLNRSLRSFDEMMLAVEGIVLDRTAPVRLSGELAIAQGELNAVRETALAHERAAAQEEQRKNELVTYLAHDIRTPLTGVVGYLSLLDEAPDLPAGQRGRYVKRALDGALKMEALIGELFEVARFNLARTPIERQRIDARLLCGQVADELEPLAMERGLSIAVNVAAPEHVRLLADPEKLARALGNVVRNAVAFADEDTPVAIDACCAGDGAPWTMRVTNRGREIAPEHLERIFDQFWRADAARSTGGGTGLGLAIARDIVQAHGGSIGAESAGGVTAVTITLPGATAPESDGRVEPSSL